MSSIFSKSSTGEVAQLVEGLELMLGGDPQKAKEAWDICKKHAARLDKQFAAKEQERLQLVGEKAFQAGIISVLKEQVENLKEMRRLDQEVHADKVTRLQDQAHESARKKAKTTGASPVKGEGAGF